MNKMKKTFLAAVTVVTPVLLALLVSPVRKAALGACVVIGLILGVLLYRYNANLDMKARKSRLAVFVSILIAGILCAACANYFMWNPVGAWRRFKGVRILAGALQVSTRSILCCISIVMGVIAFPATALFFCGELGTIPFKDEARTCKLRRVQRLVIPVLMFILMYVMLQFSALRDLDYTLPAVIWMLPLNTLALVAFIAIIGVFIGRLDKALSITAVTSALWSLANYFTVLYHGSPLFFSEFANFKTAMDVLPNYTLIMDRPLSSLLLMIVCQAIMIAVLLRYSPPKPADKTARRKAGIKARAVFAAVSVLSAAIVLYGYNTPSIKPKSVMMWSWSKGIRNYGYIACIYEDLDKRLDPVTKPEGYSVQEIQEYPLNSSAAQSDDHPDVILILNESFFDLNNFTDVPTDRDYFSAFYSIEGACYGRACAPSIGGGTNNAETELLTANDKYLFPIPAPFNYLDFTTEKNSIAQRFADAGYSTVAMHVAPKNYSRNKVYPLLGFQNVMLGHELFHEDFYGNRHWTDAGNYSTLNETYESLGDQPRFIYFLTFQNHGSYDKNGPEMDTVHTLRDFDDQTESINEYLTSVSMSVEAFVELTEYYRTVDRHVIICMVGDHAPSFIRDMPGRAGMNEKDEFIGRSAVPYVVWSNYGAEWPDESPITCLVDLGVMVRKMAGLPLSTYENHILELHEVAPARTVTGLYISADGSYGMYDPKGSSKIDQLYRKYFFMEYNLLKGGTGYRAELFAAG